MAIFFINTHLLVTFFNNPRIINKIKKLKDSEINIHF